MKKQKRKPRNKMAKKDLDLMVPLNLQLIGSDDDPCFAKLFDPRTSECGRCGDSELCSIAMSQKNHLLRDKHEKKGNFKDLEELEIKEKQNKLEIKKELKIEIRKLIKRGGGEYVDKEIIIKHIVSTFAKNGYTHSKVSRIIERMVLNSNVIMENKNKLKWIFKK